MDVFVELKAIISEFQAKMSEARDEMSHTSEHGTSVFGSMSKFGAVAFAAVGAAALGLGAASVKMGNELEDAHAKLERAVKNTGVSFDEYSGKVSQADKHMEALGFTNAQTEEALANGTTATGSASKALDLLSIAADLAAYKHTDLSTAMVAVAKGAEGNLRPLKQLGIDLPVVASSAEKVKVAQENLAKAQAALSAVLQASPDAVEANSKAHAKYETALGKVHDAQQKLSDVTTTGGSILDALRQKMGGQAATAADTFSGKMEVARARVEDLGAKLGEKLIPMIESLISWITQAVDWFEKHSAVAKALAITLGVVLVAGAAAYTASMIAAAAATVAATWPVLAIIAAVAALVAGVLWLANNWSYAWGTMKMDAVGAWHWIYDNALHPIEDFFEKLPGRIVGFFSGLADDFTSVFEGVGKAIANSVISALNWLIDGWNSFASAMSFTVPSWVPGIGGDSFGLPQIGEIGYFAKGGVVPGMLGAPMLAVVHGGEEVLTPAQRGDRGGASMTVNVYVQGHVLTPKGLADSLVGPVRDALLKNQRNYTRGRLST